MAWSKAVSWLTGGIVTAKDLNDTVRDDEIDITTMGDTERRTIPARPRRSGINIGQWFNMPRAGARLRVMSVDKSPDRVMAGTSYGVTFLFEFSPESQSRQVSRESFLEEFREVVSAQCYTVPEFRETIINDKGTIEAVLFFSDYVAMETAMRTPGMYLYGGRQRLVSEGTPVDSGWIKDSPSQPQEPEALRTLPERGARDIELPEDE